jgi:antitoxin ParD1/3/4
MVLLSSTMTVKTSVSLTDAQEAYARELVERGTYPSLSAVLQRGLDLLRTETEAQEAELAALRALVQRRRKGAFISMDESAERLEKMIARKRASLLRKRDAVQG